MNELITGVFIDVDKDEIRKVKANNNLATFKKLINTDLPDIDIREINGRSYQLVYDSCGPFSKKRASAFNRNNEIEYYGNLFICDRNISGQLGSLNTDDIEYIMDNIRMGNFSKKGARGNDPKPVLLVDSEKDKDTGNDITPIHICDEKGNTLWN